MTKPSILIIIPYFGEWPKWINHFMLSCQKNADINWLFFTDCGLPDIRPDNTNFIEINFKDYKKLVSDRLNINFNYASPYKLCDIKPAYGFIHKEYTTGYDFFGFGDIDVIYGNIRHFITDEILLKHQIISTHSNRISGHFCLLKNNSKMRNAFKKIPEWKKLFENKNHLSVDESKFTKIFIPHRKHPDWLKKLYSFFSPYWRNNYFYEQYSTLLAPGEWVDGTKTYPLEWYWKSGELSNIKDQKREFMYLHFMNWKSSRWLSKEFGSKASWDSPETSFIFNDKMISNGFKINPKGFHNLDN